jgi:hypothetical protein
MSVGCVTERLLLLRIRIRRRVMTGEKCEQNLRHGIPEGGGSLPHSLTAGVSRLAMRAHHIRSALPTIAFCLEVKTVLLRVTESRHQTEVWCLLCGSAQLSLFRSQVVSDPGLQLECVVSRVPRQGAESFTLRRH